MSLLIKPGITKLSQLEIDKSEGNTSPAFSW